MDNLVAFNLIVLGDLITKLSQVTISPAVSVKSNLKPETNGALPNPEVSSRMIVVVSEEVSYRTDLDSEYGSFLPRKNTWPSVSGIELSQFKEISLMRRLTFSNRTLGSLPVEIIDSSEA
jgi:hypothetical protein